ncbi:MAG: manganese efflux pump [Clostridia bacterium]|nr:manganese efflux pump [Clostridia bacterium]
MNFWSIFAIGIGLSMDAFAVSVCKGLGMQKLNVWQMATISLFFAVFQFLMPILGYYVCVNFESYVVSFDHWIAFILLGFLGAKMIFEAFKDDKEDKLKKTEKALKEDIENQNKINKEDKEKTTVDTNTNGEKLNIKELFVLAIATSIDALAVGITFAFLDVNIWGSGAIIGVTTFALCCIGVVIGNFFGSKFKKPAEITGGVILILMGLKILLEHLGVIAF